MQLHAIVCSPAYRAHCLISDLPPPAVPTALFAKDGGGRQAGPMGFFSLVGTERCGRSLPEHRQILREASRAGACRDISSAVSIGGVRTVGVTLRRQARHELIQQMGPCYREAPPSEKGALLDEIAAPGPATRVAMPCGCSITHRKWTIPLGGHQGLGQKSNMLCSWPGMRPIASAPNASSRFCRRSSRRWSGMGICVFPRRAAATCSR